MKKRAYKEPISRLLSIIHRQNQKNIAKLLQPYGIGGGHHYIFLINVLKKPGINQDQLTCELKFDKATTARSIKQLEELGYVDRKIDPGDRRSYQLHPTEKALQFDPTLRSLLEQANRKLTRGLTEEEEVELIMLLQKVNQASIQEEV
ncbi:MarR family winged helix-turn-helix transcriptional regulator [Gorillibacterium timonense]|uniref:MarR family winged helix-turn-helix transcriptional regulator n=1 Tax=Gorillibacterium timonense TaxID=1689269 RepID=UPI00071D13AE|nr:MarR family transcriptional regulator [Gorillibacterium timonense]